MVLLQCENLNESDKYFEKLLTASSNVILLGDIELTQEELEHLAKLVSNEFKKPHSNIENSLSIAVFLVWMGILHYRENFWEPVYKILKLPQSQTKWQKILGETFLKVIEKYGLFKFDTKQRYMIPILAHGYVPNHYLDSYFKDVIMEYFMERKKVGLNENLINWDEVNHIVTNWRHEYITYQNLHEQLEEIKKLENSIRIAKDLWNNREYLKKLAELKKMLKESDELEELLNLPDNWLEIA
ncbi:MAG: hypothetical protein QXP04_05345, partial [Candidatus Nanoarchaeia archaeon]|nr:hypothetical protein [Candidatus Jingweiarchaeum tengchongense]